MMTSILDRVDLAPRVLALAAFAFCLGCNVRHDSEPTADSEVQQPPARKRLRLAVDPEEEPSRVRFQAVTDQSGIDFTYYGGPSAQHYMTEQNGGGVGLLDFDGDGVLDIFLPNGSHFTSPAEQTGAKHHLYRSTGNLLYENVAGLAGIAESGFGMGCAVGDYDNDGFVDLYLTQYGANRLWHNNGDGTFDDVTARSGVGDGRWGTSASFADLDGDGNLDLYVVNYVQWKPDDPPCYTQHTPRVHISCGPIGRAGQPDVLYHSAGDGTFRDVSETSGIIRPEPKGLGLAIADFDADGLLDIYVANDTTENYLFQNQGGMKFEETGIEGGVAVGSDGLAHSGMGVACGDVNNDGRFDLLVTNFDNQVNDLYKNLGQLGFSSANREFGLDAISLPVLGFGAVFSDFDLDGNLDAFVANGHVWDLTVLGKSYAYAMPPQLLRNINGRRFRDVSTRAGPYFQTDRLGRGVVAGDLDRDGDEDLVVTHLEAPAALLRNDSDRLSTSCRLRLVGKSASRQPLGARVDVKIGERRRTYWLASGGSFQSAGDTQLVLVCDESKLIDELTVHWPGQQPETWHRMALQPQLTLLQGSSSQR